MRAFIVAALSVVSIAPASVQEIRLPVGDARVTGRVVAADTGAPLAGALVSLEGINLPPDLAYRTTADAGGAFDFQNVYAPREYRLTAAKAGFYTKQAPRGIAFPGEPVVLREGQSVSGVTVAMNRGGAIAGRVVDEYGDPVAAIRVYAQRLQYGAGGSRGMVSSIAGDVTDDLGQFRAYQLVPGDYLVVATGRSARQRPMPLDIWSPIDSADTVPTFYPGTVNVSEAQVVSLAGGEQSVQIVLRDQRPVSISGTVRRADGSPAVGMQIGMATSNGVSYSGRAGGTVASDGSFTLVGIAPGTYVIEAFALPTAPRPDASGSFVMPTREQGAATVTVGGQDIRDVAIVTSAGATVTGTVVFDRPFTGQSFQLAASATDLRLGTAGRAVSEQIGPDGHFEMSGVYDRSRLSVVTPGWIVKSATVDGRDIGEGLLEPGGRSRVTGVQVTVTDRLSEVSIRAVDDRKRPLGNHTVFVLRLDAGSLSPGDRIAPYPTDAEGNAVVRRIRAGSYVAGLVAELEPGEHFAPDFQDRLRVNGHRFSVNEGDLLRLELQPTTGLLIPR